MTKEAQRAELHKTIWRIANDLRGSVDGWDFKTYVLGMLFYRFISENLTAYLNAEERAGGQRRLRLRAACATPMPSSAATETVDGEGLLHPAQRAVRQRPRAGPPATRTSTRRSTGSSPTSRARRSAPTARTTSRACSTTSTSTATSSAPRSPSATRSWSSCSTPSATCTSGEFADNTIDAFGDAYEYLMPMYASSAGKSGGEFYTPQEVSELLARITVVGKTEVNKVYDPACGSGSLLLQVRQGARARRTCARASSARRST